MSFSPILLGAPEIPVIQPLSFAPAQGAPAPVGPPGPWEFAESWITDTLNKKFKVGIAGDAMTMSVRQDDGSFKHEALTARYWQVMRRIRTPDGNWHLEIWVKTNKHPAKFLLPSADLCRPEPLKTAFSSKECHIQPNQRAMHKTQEILLWEQARLHDYHMETVTYPSMGWATVDHVKTAELTGEFVMGDMLYAPKQPPRKILLGESVSPDITAGLETRGTTKEWVDLIDRIYNRPGAEAYQFCLALSFASPLVKLVPGAGGWNGIPTAICGTSGAAKTSTCHAAMSVWGHGKALTFNAGTKEAQGDTITALAIKIGSVNNLPCVLDEMSGLEPVQLGGLLYMLSNGKPRDRSDSSGQKLVINNQVFANLPLFTANDDFHEKLTLLPDSNTQDATRLRCFQIPILELDLKTVFADIDRTTIDSELLSMQYGCVGREWIQHLVNNREAIQKILGSRRATFQIDDNDRSAIRFFKDLLVTVEVSSRIAHRKGLIHWDVDVMMEWAKQQVRRLRDGIFEKDWDSTISDFVASLHGRTIVTKHMKLGRGRRTTVETPLENLSSSAPPVARRAIEDRLMFVTANSVHDWCKHNRVAASVLISEMHKRGFFTNRDGSHPDAKQRPALINIGSGTSVTRAQAQCYELDYDVVVNRCGSDKAHAADNEWAEGKLTDLQEAA